MRNSVTKEILSNNEIRIYGKNIDFICHKNELNDLIYNLELDIKLTIKRLR